MKTIKANSYTKTPCQRHSTHYVNQILRGCLFHTFGWLLYLFQRTSFELSNHIFSTISNPHKILSSVLNPVIQRTRNGTLIPTKVLKPIVNLKSQIESNIHSFRIKFSFLSFSQPRQLICKDRTTHLVRRPIIRKVVIIGLLLKKPSKLLAQTKELLRSGYLKEQLVLLFKISVMLFLVPRNCYCNSDCQNSTQTLHPPRRVWRQPFMLHPKCYRSNQQPESSGTEHKPPKSPQRSDNHWLRDFPTRHRSWLLAIKKSRACLFPYLPSMKEAA